MVRAPVCAQASCDQEAVRLCICAARRSIQAWRPICRISSARAMMRRRLWHRRPCQGFCTGKGSDACVREHLTTCYECGITSDIAQDPARTSL